VEMEKEEGEEEVMEMGEREKEADKVAGMEKEGRGWEEGEMGKLLGSPSATR